MCFETFKQLKLFVSKLSTLEELFESMNETQLVAQPPHDSPFLFTSQFAHHVFLIIIEKQQRRISIALRHKLTESRESQASRTVVQRYKRGQRRNSSKIFALC